MSLEEQIKLEEEQLKKELEEQEAEAKGAEEQGDDADGEDENAGDSDEEQGDDADGEDENAGDNDEEQGEDGKKADNSLAAQLRIERKQRKEMEKRLDALLAQQRQGQQPQAQQQAAKPEGQQEEGGKAADPNSVEARLERFEREKEEQQLYSQAVEEFNTYEREFAQANPDYEAASKHVVSQMVNSFRSLYPTASDAQAQKFIQNQLLTLASQAVNRGVNPAEALYSMAYDRFGYSGQSEQQSQNKGQNAAKKLSTVSKNKRRSASPLQSGGQNGSPNATMEEAANMNLADFSKLSESEIDQMINDLQ